jgi:glycolate oxidase
VSAAPHLDELVQAMPGCVLTDAVRVAEFSTDASRAELAGPPAAVVAASSTQDVSTALRWASRYGVPVSVRGSGTGLTGGAVGYSGGLVISLAAMDAIMGIDASNRLADVQAGVITADIDGAAAEHGLMYAPDPASYRESTIGGNIATNAGGLRCVKYGVTADSIAGLEVVLASGEVITTGGRTRKDVVGYDLTRLFVGSEGTLGVVTAATVRLQPRPSGDTVTFRASFPTLVDAGAAVTAIMHRPNPPEVMELMDRLSVQAVERHRPSGGRSIGAAAAVLVGQFIGPRAREEAAEVAELCHRFAATAVDRADDDTLLESRRVTGRALSAEGLRVSSDVAVPISRLAEMFAAIEQIGLVHAVVIPTFAHAGDGNLHPSVIVDPDDPVARVRGERILDLISDEALALGGTLTGEHGIGSLKRHSLPKQLDPATLAAHRLVKDAFDPQHILSPDRGI